MYITPSLFAITFVQQTWNVGLGTLNQKTDYKPRGTLQFKRNSSNETK